MMRRTLGRTLEAGCILTLLAAGGAAAQQEEVAPASAAVQTEAPQTEGVPTPPPEKAAAPASSRPAAAAARKKDDSGVYLTLGEVEVKDTRLGPLDSRDVLTSVDILGGDQVENENVNESMEVLRRVPGIYMENFNQGVISSDLGLRGFNSQGDVAHAKLLVDGIPSNLHVGFADMKAIFPLEIERIEVVKGTNDPRFGLYNVAGNINVLTRKAINERKVRLLGGSFGTLEPQALVGLSDGRLHQTYFGAYRRSGGYRENSDLQKGALSAKVFYDATDRLTVGLIARGFSFEGNAPGYLTEDLAQASPTLSPEHSGRDGGRQQHAHLSAHLDWAVADTLSWSFKAYGQLFRRARWIRFDPAFSQQERVENEKHYGALSTLTWRPAALPLALEWGADYQLQDNVHQRFQTTERERTGRVLRNHDFLFHTLGSYVQVDARPLERVRLMGALRVDRVAGTFQDVLGERQLDINDYGLIWQPKLSAVVTPFDNHSLYANYGRTFQLGVGIGAYKTQAEDLRPSLNDGWEVGYRLSPLPWLSGRAAYWQQHATNEVMLRFDNSGESENIGATLRRGVDVELTLQPLPTLALWGAYSRHTALQLEPGPAHPERRGKQLSHVPNYSAKAGVDYSPLPGLKSSAWLYVQGSYYVTKDETLGRHGAFSLLNGDVTYDILAWLTAGASVRNALGSNYSASVWHKDFGTPQLQLSPGDTRAFYGTLTASF